mgnify:CR=1 FL=1
MPTLKEKAYIAAGDATDKDNQAIIQQLINEAEAKDSPIVTIGKNGKLVKNSLFLSEIERAAIEIVAVWCKDTKRDLSKFAFNVQYHHNSTQVTLTNEFGVLDICHGVQITASILDDSDRMLLDIILGDEIFGVADEVRHIQLLHAITEALYAVVRLEDDENNIKSFKAIASSNKKHSDKLREHMERWFKRPEDGGFTVHDETKGIRRGDDNTVNRPRVMTGKSVAMWKRIGLKHDVFNIINRPFREDKSDDDSNPSDNPPTPEMVKMHCGTCDPKMKYVDSIHPRNAKRRTCTNTRTVSGKKVTCSVNLVDVAKTVEANKKANKG